MFDWDGQRGRGPKAWVSALGVLLLASACQTSSPVTPPPEPAPDVNTGPSQAETTGIAAMAAAAMVETHATKTVDSVLASLPMPKWSRFDGMKGPRVRSSMIYERPKEPGPVIFIMLDTTRADHLSAYGYHRPTTPNLEELSAEGVRFSRFYGNGAWTRPSVASMMTSRFRSQHGAEVIPGELKQEHVTVAEAFKEAGYATAAFVGNQTVRSHYGFDQGFERYDDIFEELNHDPSAHELVDRAQRWIERNENPQWFMWLFLVDPHDPYNPAASFDRWAPKKKIRVGTPEIEYAQPLPDEKRKRLHSLYDAEILEMDDAIGKLMTFLKESGRWDNLTVVVVADHGEAFGEHNCYRHAYHFWEATLHLPMIIRSPYLMGAEGAIEDRLFSGVDMMPTMLDLAGIKGPEGWSPMGTSALDVMTGPINEGWRRAVFTEMDGYGIKRSMMRRGDMKYLRFEPTNMHTFKYVWPNEYVRMRSAINKDVREYLFNVAQDPLELNNLAESQPELTAGMRHDLQAFKTSLEDFSDDDGQVVEEFDPQELEDLRSLGYVE